MVKISSLIKLKKLLQNGTSKEKTVVYKKR